uniref:SH3 domain-containing protein n=1 Tax=Glossina pallidipes TaxID=7398 RepID=A0A1A9ZNA6_GLOPL
MWTLTKATNLYLMLIVEMFFILPTFALSDKRLCADEKCSSVISVGRGTITYRAGEKGMVSFQINAAIRIKSKSAGRDTSLWGVEVNGREGFAPKQYIKETKVFIKEKDLKYMVSVILPNDSPSDVIKLNTTSGTKENDVAGIASAESRASAPINETKEAIIQTLNKTTTNATTISTEISEETKIPFFEENRESFRSSKEVHEEEEESDDDEFVEDYEDDEENEIIDEEDEELESENPQPTRRKVLNVDSGEVRENDNGASAEEALKGDDDTRSSEILSTPLPLTKNDQNINNIKSSPLPLDDAKTTPERHKNSESGRESEEKPLGTQYSGNSSIIASREQDSFVTQSSDNTNVPNEDKLYPTNTVPTNESSESQERRIANSFNSNQVIEMSSEADPVSSDGTIPTEAAIVSSENETGGPKSDINNSNERVGPLYEGQPTTTAGQSTIKEVPDTAGEVSLEKRVQNEELNHLTAKVETESSVSAHKELEMKSQIFVKKDSDSHEKIATAEKPYQGRQDEATPSLPIIDKSVIEIYAESTTPLSLADSSPTEMYTESTTPLLLVDSSEVYVENTTPLPPPYQPDSSFNEIYAVPTTPSPFADSRSTEMYFEKATSLPLADSSTTELVGEGYEYTTVTEQYADAVSIRDLPAEAPQISTAGEKNDFVSEVKPPELVREPIALPSKPTSVEKPSNEAKEKGLFATILSTVNNMLVGDKKHLNQDNVVKDDELDKILYPVKEAIEFKKHGVEHEGDQQYCEKLGPNDCPRSEIHNDAHNQHSTEQCVCSNTSLFSSNVTFDNFIDILLSKVLEMSELLACLIIAAAATLFFIFGYYCFCNNSREGALLSKLNQLESSLLASHKENAILKFNLIALRQKLANIDDNTLGSNNEVISLQKKLKEEMDEKARLQEHVFSLQKDLENAADDGIELNKIVAELLSNQTGDESIISNTILDINTRLAEKSRENSELQLLIAEQNARYESQIENIQRDNDELEAEKGSLITRLEELKSEFDRDINVAMESKNFEIKRLQEEIVELSSQLEAEHTKWQTSLAKVEALQECLKSVKHDPKLIAHVVDVANVRAEVFDAQKKYATLKERFDVETDGRKLAENQLEIVSSELARLKQDFNQAEKDKLEAQTRLEVLSNYFKEKETQLQKELSLKEAMWLKQQGETTTTVDRLTAMQDEIQSLKSQNDALRAEMEAQIAAHKAQIGTLENRAHETWLAARQADRRYEESRAEAAILRRKLTALAGGNKDEINRSNVASTGVGDEIVGAPSPLHMEAPNFPLMGRLPPPPFLPPPFMGPPPPFMRLPPPPFVPPGEMREMRPAPLGRIMSPPPPHSVRFSPHHVDYEDYVDYEHENNWPRHPYSPPPRTYRSLSPTDSRYNYVAHERDLISTYDTETDFSRPPSPEEARKLRSGHAANGSRNGNCNTKNSSVKKGIISSDSDNSNNSSSQQSKSKNGAVKSIV